MFFHFNKKKSKLERFDCPDVHFPALEWKRKLILKVNTWTETFNSTKPLELASPAYQTCSFKFDYKYKIVSVVLASVGNDKKGSFFSPLFSYLFFFSPFLHENIIILQNENKRMIDATMN